MKTGTPQHPKTGKLMTALGVPRYVAVGILESLWHFVERYAADGDIGKYGPLEIASAIDWKDDAGALMEALVASRWIDKRGKRMLIHDWPEHCTEAVHLRLARAGEYFADGSKPRTSRLAKDERAAVDAQYQTTPTKGARRAKSVRPSDTQNAHAVATAGTRQTHRPPNPSPPSPAPSHSSAEPEPERSAKTESAAGVSPAVVERPSTPDAAADAVTSKHSDSGSKTLSQAGAGDDRATSRKKWFFACGTLYAAAGSDQGRADHTCAIQLFDDLLWPADIDAALGRARVAKAKELARSLAVKTAKVPMAYLTARLRTDLPALESHEATVAEEAQTQAVGA